MPLTILLADGSVTARNMGKKILAAAGYDVVTASNGIEALKKIAEAPPDIALLDVYMPGYSGVEVCKKTKATAEMAQIPILLTVGKVEPFCAEEVVKIKADGLIIKPFDVSNLITAVEKSAEQLPRSEAAPPPSLVVHAVEGSKELAGGPQSRPEETEPASRVSDADLHSATPERSEAGRRIAAARDKTALPASSQGGEICDVCGHVNPEDAFACQRCDVPLRSSVLSPSAHPRKSPPFRA